MSHSESKVLTNRLHQVGAKQGQKIRKTLVHWQVNVKQGKGHDIYAQLVELLTSNHTNLLVTQRSLDKIMWLVMTTAWSIP